ncbi:MAG: hypothetical protein K0U98_10700 [Deltaproteobacteria bacterium]|nr:hypothetical protein [Deltaproteobacteria bacterium]
MKAEPLGPIEANVGIQLGPQGGIKGSIRDFLRDSTPDPNTAESSSPGHRNDPV